jgi:hypothetical protein
MLDRLMPYANSITANVPHYGKLAAITFVVTLLFEVSARMSKKADVEARLGTIGGMKGMQLANLAHQIKSFSFNTSYPLANRILSTGANSLACLGIGIVSGILSSRANEAQVTRGEQLKRGAVILDRPPVVVILASVFEIANVASKVINSCATGIVAQKMWSGGTTGKIRFVVTTALLALSFWNIRGNTPPSETKQYAVDKRDLFKEK